jgi:hypothetical protein
MEEHEDDLLMQLLVMLAFGNAEGFVKLVRNHSISYSLELTGRDFSLTFSTLVKFVRTIEPDFSVKAISYYTKQIKEVVPMKDASLSSDVPGMPSRRDKRFELPTAFMEGIKEVTVT